MFSFFNVQAVPSLYDDEDVTGEQVEIFGIMMSTIKKSKHNIIVCCVWKCLVLPGLSNYSKK